MIVTSTKNGLLMGIAVADSALFITGVWSFVICYVMILVSLTLFVYFNQEE